MSTLPPPPPMFKKLISIPEIFTEIIAAIKKEDLQIQEIVSQEICEYKDEDEDENLLSDKTKLIRKLCNAEEGLGCFCARHNGKPYTLLHYAIIMVRPNWVQQLLNCGALPTPSRDGNDIYKTASDRIKMIPQIKPLLKTIGYVGLPKKLDYQKNNGSGGGGSGGGVLTG